MQETQTIDKEYLLKLLAQAPKPVAYEANRQQSFKALKELELPSRKDELWRQTPIHMLLDENYRLAEKQAINPEVLDELALPESNLLVFVNGNYCESLSRLANEDIQAVSLQMAATLNKEVVAKYLGKSEAVDKEFFSALNTAYAHDGAFVYIPKNKKAERLIHLFFIGTKNNEPAMAQYRNLIVAEQGAEAKILVSQVSEGENKLFHNTLTEVFVQDNAKVELNWLQKQSKATKTLNYVYVNQSANSRFVQNSFSLEAGFIRNDVQVDLKGENAETILNGIYIPHEKEHFGNTILVNHHVPHCNSNQVYKGIINDEASSDFRGRVLVAKDAQKTNANQSNRNILLTKRAKASSKPQLEIYADDVACSHGSTTGQLDKEALFYLQARGIAYETARRLLLYAFVGDLLEEITIPELKEYVNKELHKRFD